MKALRTRYLVGSLLALAATATSAQTHCKPGEEVVLDCHTGRPGMQLASLCASPMRTSEPDARWLQFRFGTNSKVEVSYPQEKAGSLKHFEAVKKDDTLTYAFNDGRSLYTLRMVEKAPISKGRIFQNAIATLRITSGGQELTLQCRPEVTDEYWTRLVTIAPLTRQPAGAEDSVVAQYGKQAAK